MNEIGLDTRMIQNTGIGTYLRGLLAGLSEIPETQNAISTYSFSSPIYSVSEQFRYSELLPKCRLWHAPHYNIPFFKGNTKLVVTIHDLIHWVYRNEFFTPLQRLYAKTMFRRVISKADHIIAVSEHTRRDLISYFQGNPSKISVVYESVESDFKFQPPAPHVLKSFGIQGSYFLFVGSFKPHKNVKLLIRTFQKLRQEGKLKSCLVLVGKKETEDFHSDPNILHIGQISKRDLIHLYNGALALVHPSLYEGFGLTLLEAMACGTPVLSSTAASLPEVGGEAALFFNPQSEDELASRMLRVESEEPLRLSLRQKGFENLKRFSWKKTAEQTWKIYQKVLKS